MQTKKRRSENKELKSQKAQAQAINMDYLVNELKLQTPSASSVSRAGNNTLNIEYNEIGENEVIRLYVFKLKTLFYLTFQKEIGPSRPKKMKKSKSFVPSKKIKYTRQNEAQKDELSRTLIVSTESSNKKAVQLTASTVEGSNMSENPIFDIEEVKYMGYNVPKSSKIMKLISERNL